MLKTRTFKIDGEVFASYLERSLLSGPPTSSREAPCPKPFALAPGIVD
jgi:hypothetical protein